MLHYLFLDRRILIGNKTNRRQRKNEREKLCFLNGGKKLNCGGAGGGGRWLQVFIFNDIFLIRFLMNFGLYCVVGPRFNFLSSLSF